MAINFGLSDPGGGISDIIQLYQLGRQQAMQEGGTRALSAYAQNPSADTLRAVAPFNPGFVIQQNQFDAKQRQGQQEQSREYFGNLAKGAKDQASWDRGIQFARSQGVQVPAEYMQFSPENRLAIMSWGGVKDDAPPAPTAFERDYAFIESQRPGGGRQLIDNRLDPLVPITEYDANGAGFTRYVPRSQIGGQSPAPQQGSSSLPPGYTKRPKGGATPSASDSFPR